MRKHLKEQWEYMGWVGSRRADLVALLWPLAVIVLLLVGLPAFAQTDAAPAPAAPSPLLAAFWQFVFPLLLSGLGALASWALVRLATYLGTLGVTNKWALLGAQLTTLVQHVVADAEVSLRPLFAKSMEDGKLTPEEGAALKAAVIELLKREAPDLVRQLGAATGGLLDKVLGGAVEQAVAKLPPSSGSVLEAANAKAAAGPQTP